MTDGRNTFHEQLKASTKAFKEAGITAQQLAEKMSEAAENIEPKNIKLPNPWHLQIGDTISIRGERIQVKRLEHLACSSRGTHVNGQHCFMRTVPVTVLV